MLHSSRFLFLLCLLTLVACSMTQNAQTTTTNDPNLFIPKPGEAKIFLYATYDSPDNKPYFEHHFQFLLTGYEQTIDDQEFIATNMDPDGYHLHVDEIDWGGNTINNQTLPIGLYEGKIYFFAAHSVDGKLTVTATPEALGRREILARKAKCLCVKPLKQTLNEFFDF